MQFLLDLPHNCHADSRNIRTIPICKRYLLTRPNPTDVLLNDPRFHHFRKEQCFEIRQMAIFGMDRARLLATVLGEQNLRDTLFYDLYDAFSQRGLSANQ